MAPGWDTYTRWGVDLTASAASVGWTVAKSGTKLGFSITRSIASAAVGVGASAIDNTLFGGMPIASPALSSAVSSAITLTERLALAPIFLGEYITATSLLAAHSSINVLSVIFPGSHEASFSLASFIQLVKREWNDPNNSDQLPTNKYGLTEMARALVAWGALQGVTQEWQEKKWLRHLHEIKLEDSTSHFARHDPSTVQEKRASRIKVTSDVIYPQNMGQIVEADIGEPSTGPSNNPRRSMIFHSSSSADMNAPTPTSGSSHGLFVPGSPKLRRRRHFEPIRMNNAEMKATLRRLSKMVLAGYGGASLLFFGINPINLSPTSGSSSTRSPPRENIAEEARLAEAVGSSEVEADGDQSANTLNPERGSNYSWWDILLGRHDHEIFERFANSPVEQAQQEVRSQILKATAIAGVEHQMPRFWVLTDHDRKQVVLVLRGTMSLNELAVDLTCEPAEFEPAVTTSVTAEDIMDDRSPLFPGYISISQSRTTHDTLLDTPQSYRRTIKTSFSSVRGARIRRYHVHGGMLRMARAMGDIGRPVYNVVRDALARNEDYELVICGHSLGAGVAALLGLTWADPRTCMTVHSCGLPAGRRTSVFCFAPPCLTDGALSALANNLIVSLVYSNDVVSRLSLGSVRDIKNAALWLCEAEKSDESKYTKKDRALKGEGYTVLTNRAKKWAAGQGYPEDPEWFIAIRKTLEANMAQHDLYPPGRVLWALRDGQLHPSHRLYTAKEQDKLRLFEVSDVEQVFSQIVFAKDMLSAHLPHQYDQMVHELL